MFIMFHRTIKWLKNKSTSQRDHDRSYDMTEKNNIIHHGRAQGIAGSIPFTPKPNLFAPPVFGSDDIMPSQLLCM